MSDPFRGKEWHRYANDVRKNMVPKMKDSAYVMSIVPGEPDVKFATELGFALMMDKPLFLVVPPGIKVTEHMVRCADKIIEMTEDADRDSKRILAAITEYEAEHPDG